LIKTEDWTFRDENTRDYTHVYHDYPARMIPQIPRKIFNLLDINKGILFDPYCGTGSSLVEGLIRGLDVIGTDINPLAKLIAETKTDYSIDPQKLRKEIDDFIYFSVYPNLNATVPNVKNISFWFKDNVIKSLGIILSYLQTLKDENIRMFFNVAFSETVRLSSNMRRGEFKLFRYPEKYLVSFNPDPFKIMVEKLERNYLGYLTFKKHMDLLTYKPKARIYSFDAVKDIPNVFIMNDYADIVITSPPYGDSHTTVAYGQYSRLSSEWLGLSNPNVNVDKLSMGGNVIKSIVEFDCQILDLAIDEISNKNEKRAKEVVSFYIDLQNSIKNVSKITKKNGYAVYIVADRTVSDVILPTSEAVKHFFTNEGFRSIDTYVRNIPNKRMPILNSPTNVIGDKRKTMNKEFIIIMKKTL